MGQLRASGPETVGSSRLGAGEPAHGAAEGVLLGLGAVALAGAAARATHTWPENWRIAAPGRVSALSPVGGRRGCGGGGGLETAL